MRTLKFQAIEWKQKKNYFKLLYLFVIFKKDLCVTAKVQNRPNLTQFEKNILCSYLHNIILFKKFQRSLVNFKFLLHYSSWKLQKFCLLYLVKLYFFLDYLNSLLIIENKITNVLKRCFTCLTIAVNNFKNFKWHLTRVLGTLSIF